MYIYNILNILMGTSSAANYAAVTPDGRYILAVGDCAIGEFYDACLFQKVGRVQVCKNAAFSCCWDHTSTKFAVACQDGFLSVWDFRKYDVPMKTFESEQSFERGAFRSVKFSPSGLADLLFFSEHESLAHVVDARTLNYKQTLRTDEESSYNVNIAGICFSPNCESLFIATEKCTYEYVVDLTLRRRFPIGEYN
jgi:WD40 repeat protein